MKRRKRDPECGPESDPEWDPQSSESSESDPEDDLEVLPLDDATRKQFVKVRNEVEKTEPNIINILKTPMLLDDQAELFQLFEVYKTVSRDVSISRLEIRKEIQTKMNQAIVKYKQYHKYSEQEHKNFNDEIKSLEQYDENEELKYDILKLDTTKENKQTIYNEYKRMCRLPFTDDELPKLRSWIKCAISLPHNKLQTIPYHKSELTKFLQTVSRRMDEELYGMTKVKEQLLTFLNSRIINPKMQKCSLGLLGPPGVGKTSIVKLLADILNYPLQQISLGGVHSPEFLKGHQYTYVGAEPGEIVKCVKRMGVKNGILFFDEYDKVSENKDVCAALLHITDSSQNEKYQDNFLSGITVDLSYLWFVYSMNKRPSDDALADRIFYVEIEGYSQLDKFHIVKNYLLKRVHQNMNWEVNSVFFQDDAILYLIDKVSPSSDKGIRALDHAISTIAHKINFLYHHQNKQGKMTSFKTTFDIGKKLNFPFHVGRENVDKFLN
jgi:ATP-dependent Lon protease